MLASSQATSTTGQPFVFHFNSRELQLAISRELRGTASGALILVDGDSEVVLYPNRTEVVLRPGWILVALTLESDQTGMTTLTIPIAVGSTPASAVLVGVTEASPRGDAMLAARWGEIAQDIVWNAILRSGQSVLDTLRDRTLQIAGLYTDGKQLSFLASPPVTADDIINYYDARTKALPDGAPDFDPKPVDLFPTAKPPRVVRFALIDADTGKAIPNYEDLRDGAVIDYALIPAIRLNIRAETDPDAVGSVVFGLNRDSDFHTDSDEPYLLFGERSDRKFSHRDEHDDDDDDDDHDHDDDDHDHHDHDDDDDHDHDHDEHDHDHHDHEHHDRHTRALEPGDYSIKATPYSKADGEGDAGESLSIRLTVINTPRMRIKDFSLINAETGKPVPGFDPLPDGTVLNLAALPTRHLNIAVRTVPETVGSVVFKLDDKTRHQIDNEPPYVLYGDQDDFTWTPSKRSYEITAIPYSASHGRGMAGESSTLHVRVVDNANPAVIGLTLIDADKDVAIRGFDPIPDGTTIDLSLLPTRNLNIRADTMPPQVGSVVFDFNRKKRFATQNDVPYALFGDNAGDYLGHVFDRDKYEITATPYTRANGDGKDGDALTVSFTIIDQMPPLAVLSFTLIDADKNEPVRGYDPIPPDAVISLEKVRIKNYNIRASVRPDQVGSVMFTLNDEKPHIQNYSPYALFGDDPRGNYMGERLRAGTYKITAVPYPQSDARGKAGVGLSIRFRVESDSHDH